jgi:SAM-dependent methyltransferase
METNYETLVPTREAHIAQNNHFNQVNKEIQGLLYIIEDIKSRKIETPSILELGVKRSNPTRSTHHKEYFATIDTSKYVLSDFDKGLDVEVTADIHKLDEVFKEEQFDYIISYSVHEHLKYPDLAALKMLKCLKVGGVILIQTHQTYPLHGYPFDFYRFSREALEAEFNPLMGCEVITSYYNDLAVIIPHKEVLGWNDVAETYLGVGILVRKTSKTPKTFKYDI